MCTPFASHSDGNLGEDIHDWERKEVSFWNSDLPIKRDATRPYSSIRCTLK